MAKKLKAYSIPNQSGFNTLELSIVIVVILILGFSGWFVYKHVEHTKSSPSLSTKTVTKVPATKAVTSASNATSSSSSTNSTKQQTKSSPSYYVGNTQTDGSISITLDDTGTGTTMEQIPSDETIFSVDITVVNNGTTIFDSNDAFVGLSSVYTQVGTDTSTGKYNPAYSTPCFGGGDVSISPGQSVKGCVQFMVPNNASVDTYFYDNLKWYL
ncbi:MAG TPA: DUF4352 domain-containing protein [Candidatus Saccharimonadia bacterium]|nr:DUF4352 domain-containing protein [Candidatus Saccharimonadia bacterium]